MVIGMVGWGSVQGQERGGWGGGWASPAEDPIDVLLTGESLSAGVAVCRGVVNGLSLAVDLWDSLSPMSFIDPSELLCSLTLCLPSVPGKLGELFCNFNNRSWRLPSSPWNVEPFLDFSLWELWCRLVVLLWGSGGSCRDSYGFVPVYDGRVLCSSPTVWVFSWGKECSVGKIEVVPDKVELRGGADKNVVGSIAGCWYWDIPRTTAGRLLRGWGTAFA